MEGSGLHEDYSLKPYFRKANNCSVENVFPGAMKTAEEKLLGDVAGSKHVVETLDEEFAEPEWDFSDSE